MPARQLRTWVGIFCILCLAPAFASDLENAAREVDAFKQELIEEKLKKIPDSKPDFTVQPVPLTEGGEKFLVKKITLTGTESFTPETFAPILLKYGNKELDLGEIEAIAQELERDYLNRGTIAAVIIPAQEIREGEVVLQVIEAKMGELIIQKHPWFNSERLFYYWKIPGGSPLNYGQISESIQRMNENPDRDVRAALRAGKKTGTTDVILSPKTRFPLHAMYSFDNQGIVTTGKSRFTYGIRDNNFFGLDDTFIAARNFGDDFNSYYAYENLPLNFYGTSLIFGYSKSRSRPQKQYAPSAIVAVSENTSITLHQDIYRDHEYIGEGYLGFNAKDKAVNTSSGILNRDRLRIFNLGANMVFRSFGSSTTVSPSISRGVHDFGATPKVNPYASNEADSAFTQFNLTVAHKKNLPLDMQGNIKFAMQLADRKLTPQQQFALGGIDSNRGYPSSDYLADCMGQLNTELLIPAFFIPGKWRIPYSKNSLKQQTTILAFADYSYGMSRQVEAPTRPYVNMVSIGPGVRFSLFDQALLRLEWGFQVGANRAQTEGGRSQFNFAVDFQDKFPGEIERIIKMRQEEFIAQVASGILDEEFAKANSPLRDRLLTLFLSAQESYAAKDYEAALDNYNKIIALTDSINEQAVDYVRSCMLQEKSLKDNNARAAAFLKAGKPEKAKELWEKVISEGQPNKLTLDLSE